MFSNLPLEVKNNFRLSSINSLDLSYEFHVLVDTAPVVPGSTQYTIIIVVIVIILLVAFIVGMIKKRGGGADVKGSPFFQQ